MIPRAQVPRSMSLEKMNNGSPPNPSTVHGRLSLQEAPASLDAFRTSLTHSSSGQQQVGLEHALLSPQSSHSASLANVLSPRASGSEQPSQPVQDATSGMTWLTQQDVMDLATFHDSVTILFADIKGFTSMVNQLHPSQVMLFLNSLYSVWDSLLETFGVYKIETIGDCYMCCTGLFCYDEATGTKRLGGHDPQHARTMLEFAKAMILSSQAIKTPLGDTVQVRVGLHSGSCSSGVVGQRMPRWCLFGDTVNTANRMESNGVPGCIHASEASVKLLDGEPWRSTGGIVAKGKGLMQTSLLPILPGAAHAAALSIAQRHSANGTADGAGVTSSAPQLGSTAAEASMSDGQLQHSVTGPQSSASAGASCCPDENLMLERAELLRMPTAAASALPATAAASVPEQICQSCHGRSPDKAERSLQQQQFAAALGQEGHTPAAIGLTADCTGAAAMADLGTAADSPAPAAIVDLGTAADCKGTAAGCEGTASIADLGTAADCIDTEAGCEGTASIADLGTAADCKGNAVEGSRARCF
ncbi:nucleotide cyclase [Dunaliella salina]|nr:nucleotide cyclase [Dunaliella salina]|eukprot:KAF5833793.1 nucleotide cyclase [Dunaliella salina]